jgi:hypothetical protein
MCGTPEHPLWVRLCSGGHWEHGEAKGSTGGEHQSGVPSRVGVRGLCVISALSCLVKAFIKIHQTTEATLAAASIQPCSKQPPCSNPLAAVLDGALENLKLLRRVFKLKTNSNRSCKFSNINQLHNYARIGANVPGGGPVWLGAGCPRPQPPASISGHLPAPPGNSDEKHEA